MQEMSKFDESILGIRGVRNTTEPLYIFDDDGEVQRQMHNFTRTLFRQPAVKIAREEKPLVQNCNRVFLSLCTREMIQSLMSLVKSLEDCCEFH